MAMAMTPEIIAPGAARGCLAIIGRRLRGVSDEELEQYAFAGTAGWRHETARSLREVCGLVNGQWLVKP
jgi:hypothetical protein